MSTAPPFKELTSHVGFGFRLPRDELCEESWLVPCRRLRRYALALLRFSGLPYHSRNKSLEFARRVLPHLDGQHTVFGRVIDGIEVLADIQRRNPESTLPLPKPDRILKAEVIRDSKNELVFEKLPEPRS